MEREFPLTVTHNAFTILSRVKVVSFKISRQIPLLYPPLWFTQELYQIFQFVAAAIWLFGLSGVSLVFSPLLSLLSMGAYLQLGHCFFVVFFI